MEIAQTFDLQAAFERFTVNMEKLEKYQEKVTRQIEETDRQMKETDRQMKETDRQMKETDRKMHETNVKISKLGDRFGEMIEYMVKPNLVDRFRELGFVFTKVYPEASIKDKKNNILAEIDLTLENGDKVMIVEVKSKPSTKDVKEHVKRMETVRRHADLHDDKRKFLGSVAGMVISENVREFALKQGFYVIEPSGETFTITVPEGIYCPHEW